MGTMETKNTEAGDWMRDDNREFCDCCGRLLHGKPEDGLCWRCREDLRFWVRNAGGFRRFRSTD